MAFFDIIKKDEKSRARLGVINTAHGPVKTPAFLPIGTRGSVKAVTSEELKFWGADMILANTYHLWLRPGDTLISRAGGLHKFMGWDGPIFTDSGGYQVYSLGEKIKGGPANRRGDSGPILKKIDEAGVEFQNELDGATHVLSPEESIQIQSNLGSDIALVLDDVPALPATEKRLKSSLDLTLRWAQRAKAHYEKIVGDSVNPGQRLYGIVQGGDLEELRKKSAQGLQKIGFDGYGIGGLAVGEDAKTLYKVLGFIIPHLEEDKPRHLLGVGYPEQILKAISLGLDTFDCVLPTRNARHGQLFINKKSSKFGDYDLITITNAKFKEDFTPADNSCSCYGCLHHNRAYLRHLFMSGEPLGIRLATMHNLRFYLDLMDRVRRAIEFDSFS
ncbi:MAG: tRNA guanosine(34) transglycosylase Tgt [Candidatus Doudnabacteria bacterium RIFCSPHIGHO2_01_FULL_49_9]|uniref:Queuine tRNA-ribosyltransferase n=1 Tax=Candidatus Doudnabacteria bacterium RIFCSPHIGHO2_01_FULL_49_9 TaxID=1817827 RepID=A0A1F5P089_9BACT|nr:MAG: tRNA guanosine(34) transglycosylase Tgt [Candidatus Doudnabacteria bacterium RIFCSPHIGHO2_01_FULL_49_9]